MDLPPGVMGSPPNRLGRNAQTDALVPAQLGKPVPTHKSPPEVCVAPAEQTPSCRLGCLGKVAGLAAVPAAQERVSNAEGTPGAGCLLSPDSPGDTFHSSPKDA